MRAGANVAVMSLTYEEGVMEALILSEPHGTKCLHAGRIGPSNVVGLILIQQSGRNVKLVTTQKDASEVHTYTVHCTGSLSYNFTAQVEPPNHAPLSGAQ